MPSPNEFVTSLNSFNSAFITRQEVIEGLSTLVSDLSGINISTFAFGTSPNPLFSTITMNPNGQINGFVPHQTSRLVFNGLNIAGYANKVILGSQIPALSNAITAVDANDSNAPILGSQLIARTGPANAASPGGFQTITGQSNLFVSADGITNVPYIVWNGQTGLNNRIALSNISTINGSPPNVNPTTYTNLSGNNITNSAVITTPSMVGLSSLNALPISAYQNSNSQPWVSYAVTNTASYPFTLTSGVQTTVLSFSNVPIPTVAGREVTISVPVTINLNPAPAQATNLIVEAYIGGSLTQGCQVGQIITVGPNSLANQRITLCGVATTTGTQPTLNIVVTSDGNVTINATQGAGTTPRQFFFQTLGF